VKGNCSVIKENNSRKWREESQSKDIRQKKTLQLNESCKILKDSSEIKEIDENIEEKKVNKLHLDSSTSDNNKDTFDEIKNTVKVIKNNKKMS